MPAAAELWTYEKYLTLGDETRSEIIEGDLTMTPAPGFSHQYVVTNLFFIFNKHIKERIGGYIVTAPTDVILSDVNIVQPDILYISKARRGIIRERGVFGPPDLVVEIISPSSHYRDVHVKKALYERFGIAEFWIVNPYMKAIEVLALNKEGRYELISDGCLMAEGRQHVISGVIEGLTVDLKEVYTESFNDDDGGLER
ncbi:MAG: Uma2 family endonuclease [Candidatus Magnetominusculus sp. LBB02]|nr:Uma2 family endonuclease [Candidatus Magnetominusculus sp. LBB02]